MQKMTREASLNIGKGVYTISTQLDNETLDRVRALIEEACGEVQKGARQEDVLVLACLRLAYGLDAVSEKLRAIAGNLSGGGE